MSELAFVCPHCHGPLVTVDQGFDCGTCSARFPIVAGIPDFRVYPDPYIDLEADRAKARTLAAGARDRSFAEVVEMYFRMTPEVPGDLARRYRDHHLAGIDRGRGLLARIAGYGFTWPRGGGRLLDLGCGTAGLLAAASEAHVSAGEAVGVDIALRWLVVARARLTERGALTHLVCACADRLPFAPRGFDLVVAEHLLEHTDHGSAVLDEARRMRAPGSVFLARSVNRFALGPEPHVGLWGVGFLPRRLMDPYVQKRKGIPYRHVHLRSFGGWRRLLRAGGHRDLRLDGPLLVPLDYGHQPAGRRRLFAAYARTFAAVRPLRPLLRRIGPYLDIVGAPSP